jgi:MFS family permease
MKPLSLLLNMFNQAGAVFGAMISSPLANRLGRRFSLFINFGIYIVGAVLMTAASGTSGIPLVYSGRVLTGWGVGASTMLVPVYVAECSPPHVRGRLVGLYEVGVQFGTMVCLLLIWQEKSDRVQIGFWISYGVLQTQKGTLQWRIPFAIQLIPAVVGQPAHHGC